MVHFQHWLHSLIASPAIHLKCESVDKAKNESEKVVKKNPGARRNGRNMYKP